MNIKDEAIKALREAAEKLFKVQIIDEAQRLDLLQIEKSMSKAKGSKDARTVVIAYLQRMKIAIKTELAIDAGTWHSYIFYTDPLNILVVYKSHWLTAYGKIFNDGDSEGTGLNRVLAQFCLDNVVDVLVIVRPDKRIWWIPLRELMEYAEEHKTIRAFRGMDEMHVPITMLREFPPEALR